MHFPQTTIYSICSHRGGEGSWVHRVTSGKSIIPSWGGQPGLIRVFPDFPAGRNLQPKAQVVVQRRDKSSPAVLTSHSCYQRIGGLWSPFIAAHRGLLGIPLPVESIGGAFPARHWDAAVAAAIPWKPPQQNLDELEICIFLKVLTEQVLSPLFKPHPGESHNQTSLAALQTHSLLENFPEFPPVAGAWVDSSLHILKTKHGWNSNVCLIWDSFGISPEQGTFYIPNPPSPFGKLAATEYPATILGFEMLTSI